MKKYSFMFLASLVMHVHAAHFFKPYKTIKNNQEYSNRVKKTNNSDTSNNGFSGPWDNEISGPWDNEISGSWHDQLKQDFSPYEFSNSKGVLRKMADYFVKPITRSAATVYDKVSIKPSKKIIQNQGPEDQGAVAAVNQNENTRLQNFLNKAKAFKNRAVQGLKTTGRTAWNVGVAAPSAITAGALAGGAKVASAAVGTAGAPIIIYKRRRTKTRHLLDTYNPFQSGSDKDPLGGDTVL